MSHDQKEEGTSHYRSGIYDVVSVPAKKNKQRSPQNVLVREDQSELCDVLSRLAANLEENTHAVRALQAHLGSGPDRSNKHRKDRVVVYLRTAFLRIIDVDTKDGTFTADIFIQASWLEPALKAASQNDLDDMDYDKVWKPNIMVTNMAGAPEQSQQWYGGYQPGDGQKYPLLYTRLSLRARFKENLQLGGFPVDSQALNVIVASEHSEAEVNFVEDLSTVNTTTFQDQSEFRLHPHVDTVRTSGKIRGLDIYERSPKMNFRCYVTRRPGFYFWNMFLVMFLITSLMLIVYVMSPDKTDYRMKVSLALLLIAVAYKLVLMREMPKTPSMSYMDGYILACLMFLVWQNIQNAIIGLIASDKGLVYAAECDKYFFAILLFVFIAFNVIYIAILIIKYFTGKRTMNDKNEDYRKKLRSRGADQYDNPTYMNHSGLERGSQESYRTEPNPTLNSNHIPPPNPPNSSPQGEHTQKEKHSHRRKHKKHGSSVAVDPDPIYEDIDKKSCIDSEV